MDAAGGDARGHESLRRAQDDQVLEGKPHITAVPSSRRQKTVAREGSHLRDGQAQQFRNVSCGVTFQREPSALSRQPSANQPSFSATPPCASAEASSRQLCLRLVWRACDRQRPLFPSPGLLERLHQVDDLGLRRLGGLLRDVLSINLALDRFEHPRRGRVLVLLGVKLSDAAWSISWIASGSSGFFTSIFGICNSAIERTSSA